MPEIDLSTLRNRIPRPSPNTLRVLGIDPGTRIVGWGVIERRGRGFYALASGAIRATKLKTMPERLEKIYDDLCEIINALEPLVAGIETAFLNTSAANVKSLIAMGQGRGIALLACRKAGLAIREYSPSTIKQSITGSGRADKEQVRDMVMRLLGLKKPPKPLDVSDALAIAWTAGRHVRFTARLKEQLRRGRK